MSLTEYNRRFDLITESFRAGTLTAAEARQAMSELTRQRSNP